MGGIGGGENEMPFFFGCGCVVMGRMNRKLRQRIIGDYDGA